jgi:hypothetical protein
VSLAYKEKSSKEEPAREKDKSDNKNIGDRRIKIALKLFLKNSKNISHFVKLLS